MWKAYFFSSHGEDFPYSVSEMTIILGSTTRASTGRSWSNKVKRESSFLNVYLKETYTFLSFSNFSNIFGKECRVLVSVMRRTLGRTRLSLSDQALAQLDSS